MTQLRINTGSVPNDRSADSLYSAFNKINANFTELYNLVGTGSESLQEIIQDYAASLFTTGHHSGITISYRDSNDRIDLTVLDQSWDQLLNKPFIPTDVSDLTDDSGLLGGGNLNLSVDGGVALTIYSPTDLAVDGGWASTIYDLTDFSLSGGGA